MFELETVPCARCGKETPSNLLHSNPSNGLLYCPGCLNMGIEEKRPSECSKEIPPFDLSRLKTGAEIVAGDYEVSFLVDRLIPENSIVLFYAKGGSGKSTLATQIAAAVVTETPFMGLATQQRPVVDLDNENPKAIVKKRVQAVPGADRILFWDEGLPQLNSSDWVDLQSLIVTLGNPLLIIDTLSSSCSCLDISSNKDMAPIMAKIVALRNLGATIILLHHTPKGDETKYIGASTIYNQCDHILAMYPVRQAGADQEAVDDDEIKTYRLGTKDKTRFDHFHLYVEFDDCSGTFVRAPDPAQEFIDSLLRFITDRPGITQTEILSKIGPKGKIKKLLKNQEGHLWTMEKGSHFRSCYYPIPACQLDRPLGAESWQAGSQLDNTGCKPISSVAVKTTTNTELDRYSEGGCQPDKLKGLATKQEGDVFDFLDEVA